MEKLFKSDFAKGWDEDKELKMLGVASYVLYTALESESKTRQKAILNSASKLFHPLDCNIFNTFYSLTYEHIAYENKIDEFTYQNLFNKNIHKILGCAVVKGKKSKRSIPDSWVKFPNSDEEIPVEVKFRNFNKKALKQLQRYIDEFGSSKGIAVARDYTVELPENIIFISLEQLKDYSKMTDEQAEEHNQELYELYLEEIKALGEDIDI